MSGLLTRVTSMPHWGVLLAALRWQCQESTPPYFALIHVLSLLLGIQPKLPLESRRVIGREVG